jgi:hypothetical protein
MENHYEHPRADWVTAGARYDGIAGQPRYAWLEWRGDLDEAWRLLLELIAELPDELVPNAGAGPLETLIHRHLTALIDRIEVQAARDARFRRALLEVNVSRGLPRAAGVSPGRRGPRGTRMAHGSAGVRADPRADAMEAVRYCRATPPCHWFQTMRKTTVTMVTPRNRSIATPKATRILRKVVKRVPK